MTKIRGGEELCRAIVGYDANALYLWVIMQDMPTGWYTRRREENGFRPQQAIWTDGRPVAHVRIGANGSQHPSPDQRTGEANRESPGRRLVRVDANCVSVPWLFLARLPEMSSTRGNEPEKR